MNRFMKVATKLSEHNLKTKTGGPFGACIVKDGKIIGKGSNRVLKDNDPTAHAEVVAIRKACKKLKSHDLSDCELYTSCYPCPMCLSAIIWSNIKIVYYGNTSEDASDIGFRDEHIYEYIDKLESNSTDESILRLTKMDRNKTIKAFKEYKEQDDKTMY